MLLIVSLLVILWVWGGIRGLGYAVTGWIILSAFSTGVNIMGQVVGWSRITRIIDLFIASPITPISYFAGSLLGSLTMFLIDAAIFTLIGLSTGYLSLVVYSLVSSLLVLPIGVLLGLSIVFRVRKPTNISAVTNPVSSILSFLPPVFYPASILPEPLNIIACLAPTAAGAELARALSGLGSPLDPLLLTAILLAWIAILIIISRRIILWSLE
ncbi:MAG TPA: ABC transporter permease [Sulfolobales archaeon]|nr:ABC transporter permease [Sulfolobales archaeon]